MAPCGSPGVLLGSELRFLVCWSLASLRYNLPAPGYRKHQAETVQVSNVHVRQILFSPSTSLALRSPPGPQAAADSPEGAALAHKVLTSQGVVCGPQPQHHLELDGPAAFQACLGPPQAELTFEQALSTHGEVQL